MKKLALAMTTTTTFAVCAAAIATQTSFGPAQVLSSPPTVTISIEELQRQVPASTLPETEIRDPY
jgi:hypothetical protein